MPLDLTLPKSSTTQFGELYSVLRDNFNGLYDKHVKGIAWTWVTTGLGTNWAIGGGGFGYMKDQFGFVYLTGFVYGTGDTSSVIWTLPDLYRPLYTRKYMAGYYYSSFGLEYHPYITINSSGQITVSDIYSKAYSLHGISFMAGD